MGIFTRNAGLARMLPRGCPSESASIDDDIASMADELSSRAVEKGMSLGDLLEIVRVHYSRAAARGARSDL